MSILGNIVFYIMMIAGLGILIEKSPVICGLLALGGVIGHIRQQKILTRFKELNR